MERWHLAHSFSNHFPLLIDLRSTISPIRNNHFRFEAWWVLEYSFEETLCNTWMRFNGDLVSRLCALQGMLTRWGNRIRTG